MADHGHVEYATADGNDYPAHESGYEQFVHFTVVGILFVLNLMFGLAVGGVMGHWFTALPIFILAIIVTEFPRAAEQAKAMGLYAFGLV